MHFGREPKLPAGPARKGDVGLHATREFGFVKTALDRTELAKGAPLNYAKEKLELTVVIVTPVV